MRVRAPAGLLVVAAAACGGGADSLSEPTPPPAPMDVTVSNLLDVPITLTGGATPLGALQPRNFVTVTLPAGQRVLAWRALKRTYSTGEAVPDDLAGADISIARSGQAVDVVNNVAGVVYFTPYVTNHTGSNVSLAIVDGGTQRCIGWQPAATSVFQLPVAWGYYRLSATTVMRVFTNTTCAGAAFGEWSTAQLQNFQPNTGVVRLSVVAP